MSEAITNIFITVLTAGFGLIGAHVVLLIRKAKAKAEVEISKIEDERQQGLLRAALDQMGTLVEKTVGSLEQTMAQDLRVAVKNGETDRMELLALAKEAAETVWLNMKPNYANVLENTMEDIDRYLEDAIEAEVLKVKALSNKIGGATTNVQGDDVRNHTDVDGAGDTDPDEPSTDTPPQINAPDAEPELPFTDIEPEPETKDNSEDPDFAVYPAEAGVYY